ncbi:MAG: GtrA family protein [Bacteroidales bacterium]|nr:GtrA family protein [Bacteroidales bacterium]MBR6330319.1 GtrA family protein [Bacteroidales bacterium]
MLFSLAQFFEKAFLMKFLKFCVVGFSGTAIDFGLTWLCKEIFKIPKFLANAIGFVVAATSNYILNRIWTWGSTNEQVGVEYVKFFAVSLIGLGLNTLILYIFNEKLKFNFYLSKVFATGVVMLWNFFANNFFTFAGV